MEFNSKKYLTSIVFPAIAIILSLVYLRETAGLAAQDVLLVKPTALILIGISAASMILQFLKMRKDHDKDRAQSLSSRIPPKVYLFILSCFIYLAVLTPLGFFLSTVGFMALASWFLGVKNRKVLAIVPVTVTFFLFFIFQVLLKVPLPAGILNNLNQFWG